MGLVYCVETGCIASRKKEEPSIRYIPRLIKPPPSQPYVIAVRIPEIQAITEESCRNYCWNSPERITHI